MNAIIHFFYLLLSIAGIVALLWLIMQWQENRTLMPSETVFVYNTLTNPLVRFYACRCTTPYAPATLSGYRLTENTITPDEAGTVTGQLLRVTRVELSRFDRFKGVPDVFVRSPITIEGQTVWIYSKPQ